MSVPTGDGAPGAPEGTGGRLLTISEVAVLMGVTKMTVYQLVHDRLLRARPSGSGFRIEPADLTEFLANGSWPPPGQTPPNPS